MLLRAEISTERKYLRLILKVHSLKESVGLINEPAEVFLGYIPFTNNNTYFLQPPCASLHLLEVSTSLTL